jgi:hypothetical protein
MLTKTVQQSTTGRLLRRALEAALPPPTQRQTTTSRGLADAVVGRVFKELQPRRDATLMLTEAEAERE